MDMGGRVLLREPELCELLGLPFGRVNKLIRDGLRVPYYAVGDRAKFFDRDEALAFFEGLKVNGVKRG